MCEKGSHRRTYHMVIIRGLCGGNERNSKNHQNGPNGGRVLIAEKNPSLKQCTSKVAALAWAAIIDVSTLLHAKM